MSSFSATIFALSLESCCLKGPLALSSSAPYPHSTYVLLNKPVVNPQRLIRVESTDIQGPIGPLRDQIQINLTST